MESCIVEQRNGAAARCSAELGGVARSNGFARLCYARQGIGSAAYCIASVGIGIALLRAAAQ